MAKYIGKGRKFLSSRFDEGSVVNWYVEQWNGGDVSGGWGCVKIRDCDRTVTLDFNIDSEADRKQRLKKLDTLIGELEKLRNCLERVEVGNGR